MNGQFASCVGGNAPITHLPASPDGSPPVIAPILPQYSRALLVWNCGLGLFLDQCPNVIDQLLSCSNIFNLFSLDLLLAAVSNIFIQISKRLICASLDGFGVLFSNGSMSASTGSRCLQVEGGWNETSEA